MACIGPEKPQAHLWWGPRPCLCLPCSRAAQGCFVHSHVVGGGLFGLLHDVPAKLDTDVILGIAQEGFWIFVVCDFPLQGFPEEVQILRAPRSHVLDEGGGVETACFTFHAKGLSQK